MGTIRKAGGATAVKLKKLLPTCSVCKAATDAHQFAVIGTTVIDDKEKPRVTQFFGHVKRREWNDLNQFKDWQNDRDNLVAYSIACPNGGGVVVAIRSPFELYDTDEVYLQELITPEEQVAISRLLLPGDWQQL